MSPASAAVARRAAGRPAPIAGRGPDLQGRLHGLLERSTRGAGRDLAERLLPTTSCGRAARLPPEEGFYWLRLARWLAESFRLTVTAGGRGLLAELQWIGYCVYAVFRVQDDLVDGAAADPLLAVQSNHLLVEASRAAARHFPGDSPFWTVYRETIDATTRAIVALDRLQRTPERPPGAELELYRELAASLKIAAAGVAIAAGREGDWRHRISPALDRLAVTAQILDDLQDLGDDLAEGRINYAAWFLSRPVFAPTREGIEAVVAANLATGDRLTRLLGDADRLLGEAAELLAPTLCRHSHAFVNEYREGLGGLGDELRRARGALLGHRGSVAR